MLCCYVQRKDDLSKEYQMNQFIWGKNIDALVFISSNMTSNFHFQATMNKLEEKFGKKLTLIMEEAFGK